MLLFLFTYHQDEGQANGEPIPEMVCDDASNHEAEDLTNDSAVTETRFPGGRDLIGSILLQSTVLLEESSCSNTQVSVTFPTLLHDRGQTRRWIRTIAIKASNDHQIITFHDQSRRGQDTPADGLGIGPDGLEDAHVVLMVGSFLGLIDEALEVDM